MELQKVISGGQTGVDRAALDAALVCGIPIGGWCPRGRRAEDGAIPTRYPLEETPSPDYPMRTRWNVRDSHATLIVTVGRLDGGTQLTGKIAAELGRPCAFVRSDRSSDVEVAVAFIRTVPGSILNVAGPRESRVQGVFASAHAVLSRVFERFADEEGEAVAFVPKKPPDKDGAEAPEDA